MYFFKGSARHKKKKNRLPLPTKKTRFFLCIGLFSPPLGLRGGQEKKQYKKAEQTGRAKTQHKNWFFWPILHISPMKDNYRERL